jgi:coenzyme F420 hydrogenase subunit beta
VTRLRDVRDVAEQHLCSGCGACAYLDPDQVTMVDDLRQGRRPLTLLPVQQTRAAEQALSVCPGRGLEHVARLPAGHLDDLGSSWGPVLELWEGYATDPEIRHRGSSGGAATAIALHCLEVEGMSGVLHAAARADVPYLNETVLSTTRDELIGRTGSRYAPASPCDGLGLVAQSAAPCVFIGKPCDVAGAVGAAGVRPELTDKLGVTIAVFCAGTPSTRGTLEAIRTLGFAPEEVTSVRYRGRGWPGRFTVDAEDGRQGSLSYEDSWGAILQKHRQWRCMVCPDHTGEFADVAVGDPWYKPTGDDPGRSLIVVRTERGRQLVRAATASGALTLTRVAPDVLPLSQPNLVHTRGAVWGRVTVMRMMGLATPRYRNLPMISSWLRLTPEQKLRSTAGTLRRIRARGLNKRTSVQDSSSAPAGSCT